MKILVTGGCGFVGSNLVDLLVEENHQEHDVIIVDNLVTGKKENCNELATYVFEDIGDVILSGDLNDVDVIYHLAAMPRIQPSFNKPLYTFKNNAQNTTLVCEFARKNNAKIVYAGSSTYYGGVYLNPYAFSKWVGEEVCKMYSEIYDVTTSIARFFNVYGPRHLKTGPYSTVVGIFEEQYKNNEPLTITGDGEQRRDFTHVNDICRGLMAMSRGSHKGEVFNLGTGVNYSINELAAMFNGAPTKYIPKRPGEAQETLADISKINGESGWTPEYNLQDYIKNEVKK